MPENIYKDKVVSVEKALECIRSGDNIVTAVAAGEAREFFTNLHTIADRVKGVRVCTCLNMGNYEYIVNPAYKESFFSDAWFYTATYRAAHDNGNMSYVPNHLHLAVDGKLAHRKPTVFVAMASMPDKHGYMSLMSNAYEKQLMRYCDRVILEINPNCPRIFGDNQIHVSDATHLIEVNYEVPELPDIPATEIDRKIAGFIAPLIEDGSCLQLGIGGTPAAVAELLYDKNDLGVHTEMFTTAMAQLAKAGVINGKCKQMDRELHVATFVLGTKELYDFVNDNPSVRVMTGNTTINPRIIRYNDKQISINAGLAADLTGQICSESVGSVHFSGTGGQADTARGAVLSKGGKSFIAFHSTAMSRDPETGAKVRISRITPQLAPGSAVSLQRNDVQYVVTEYGIVNLQGMNIQERCEALIGISHPDFRDGLREEAGKLKLIF